MAFVERRKHERMPLLADLTVQDLGSGESYSGRSINISRGGIGFYCSQCLPVGSDVRITLYLTRNGQSYRAQVYGRVARFSIETRGTIIGAMFDAELTPATQPLLCSFIDKELGL